MKRLIINKIVDKVMDILDGTDNVVNMHISIFADVDEEPTIRYSIEEVIETGDEE